MLRPLILFFVIILLLLPNQLARAQGDTIQAGSTIERSLARGESHTFTIKLEEGQFAQLVVEQRGIDVIVRSFSPAGKLLAEIDSPNGTQGPENISIVANVAGVYKIEVSPLGQLVEVAPGRYELRVVELRQATDQELLSGKNQELLKARGLALVSDMVDALGQIRLPQTRVRAQLQAADMVWSSDEKLGARLAGDAVDGVKEFIGGLEASEHDYYESYAMAMQLRQEVVGLLGNRDPEMALTFLQTTRTLPNPEGRNVQWDQELSMELSLGAQIAAKDPNRAAQLARDTLKRGYSSMLVEIVNRLRYRQPELASQLAKEITAKLMGENLLKNQDVANLALGLLRTAHGPIRNYQTTFSASDLPPGKTNSVLLSEQDFRDLFEKAVNDGLSFTGSPGLYTPERNTAQNILSALSSMPAELKLYAPEKEAVIEKKNTELNSPTDVQGLRWQKYQERLTNLSVDAALEEVGKAPIDMRDALYQEVAQKALRSGDLARARQIAKDNISNLNQQRQVLANLESQAIFEGASKGKIEDALRSVCNLRTSRERATVLSQLVNQIGPGLKRAQALALLEQARNLVGTSTKVETQEQMAAVLEIARAVGRYDSKRAFEMVEPLLEQFDEMSNAAQIMNGFGQEFYEGGELQLNNGSSMANFATRLVATLSSLATANFDRAKADADRLERPEVRIVAYLGIASQAIGPEDNVQRSSFSRGRRY
ncbi:MAG TPA: hypothetical protein VLL54_08325 [Pyrinomonadaceae bacterium]|nr:hypothetical protein [Pyrinomonadaceae bacterium]